MSKILLTNLLSGKVEATINVEPDLLPGALVRGILVYLARHLDVLELSLTLRHNAAFTVIGFLIGNVDYNAAIVATVARGPLGRARIATDAHRISYV